MAIRTLVCKMSEGQTSARAAIFYSDQLSPALTRTWQHVGTIGQIPIIDFWHVDADEPSGVAGN